MTKEHGYAYESGYQDGMSSARNEIDRLSAENCKLRELVDDELSCILGWAWALNEIAGYSKFDQTTVPWKQFREFQTQARELGVDV